MVPIVALTTMIEEGVWLMQDVGGPSTYGQEVPKILSWKPLSNVRQSAVEWRSLSDEITVWNFINLPTNLWIPHGSAAQGPNRGVWMKAGQLGFRDQGAAPYCPCWVLHYAWVTALKTSLVYRATSTLQPSLWACARPQKEGECQRQARRPAVPRYGQEF